MVNEQALIQAFQNIKKEFQSIHQEIEQINLRLTNGSQTSQTEDLKELQEQLARLNYTEDDVIASLEKEVRESMASKEPREAMASKALKKHDYRELKKNPIKEVEEFISDVNTEDLADEYY